MELQMRLPNHYEEMMYLEGGATLYTNCWGNSIYFSATECAKIAVGGSVAALVPGINIVGSIVAALAGIGAAGRGLWYNWTWLGQPWIGY